MVPLTDSSLATLIVPVADAEVVTRGVSSEPINVQAVIEEALDLLAGSLAAGVSV
jgi:hypothetical protein